MSQLKLFFIVGTHLGTLVVEETLVDTPYDETPKLLTNLHFYTKQGNHPRFIRTYRKADINKVLAARFYGNYKAVVTEDKVAEVKTEIVNKIRSELQSQLLKATTSLEKFNTNIAKFE